MDNIIKELKRGFIERKWEVETDVPIKFKEIFDYKIPMIVTQKQLKYHIFYIPLTADRYVIDAIIDVAATFKQTKIIVLAMVHPAQIVNFRSWIRNRLALTLKDVWKLIDRDVKYGAYTLELEALKKQVDAVKSKIFELENETKVDFNG
jgi:hypothetical protein